MKSTIIIMGSPRLGGNTDYAANRVKEKLSSTTNVELVRLPGIEVKRCVGCRSCMRTGKCAIDDDDFPALWEKLLKADILFQVFPVYWNSPPGIMKDFIDRTHTAYATPGLMVGKLGFLVTIAADSGFETADEIGACWFRSYGGCIEDRLHLYAREAHDLENNARERSKLEQFTERVAAEVATP